MQYVYKELLFYKWEVNTYEHSEVYGNESNSHFTRMISIRKLFTFFNGSVKIPSQ
jgi:hypothetical protein